MKPQYAIVGPYKFCVAPQLRFNKWDNDYFAVPGRRVVSKTELELWAKLWMKQDVRYVV